MDTIANDAARMLRLLGRRVELRRGGGTRAELCLLQPLRYKNKMYLEGVPTDAGLSTGEYYLLLSPAAFLAEETSGAVLFCGGADYSLIRKEPVYAGETPLYTWAVLRKNTRMDEGG